MDKGTNLVCKSALRVFVTVSSIGDSTVGINHGANLISSCLQRHRVQNIFQAPNREGKTFHLDSYLIAGAFDRATLRHRNVERSRCALKEAALACAHSNDIFFFIFRRRREFLIDCVSNHLLHFPRCHTFTGRAVAPEIIGSGIFFQHKAHNKSGHIAGHKSVRCLFQRLIDGKNADTTGSLLESTFYNPLYFLLDADNWQALFRRVFPIALNLPRTIQCSRKAGFHIGRFKGGLQLLCDAAFSTLGQRTLQEHVINQIELLKAAEINLVVEFLQRLLQCGEIGHTSAALMLRRIQDKSTRRNSLFPFGQTLFRLRFKSHRTLTVILSIILTVCHILYILAQKVIAHRCQAFDIEQLVRRLNDCF